VTVDPSVIAALEAAVDADPSNAALTAHLAGLLLEAGRAEDALERCKAGLAHAPEDAALLDAAERAAKVLPEAEPPSGYGFPTAHHADEGVLVPLRLVQGGRAQDADGLERPTVMLDDVGGLENVKKRLRSSFLGPLQNPQLRAAYAKSLRGGLLLYGPPGCGKTFIARAVAGELGARFTSIGIADVLDMYMGESERKLHELFQTARRNAPCVLFLDEVDALGQKRSHLRGSATRGTVNQLLTELDSVGDDNEGVYVLAATNHPWDVDTALRRPGRFDRMLLVLPPDAPAREAILRLHLRDRPLAGDLDLAPVVKSTANFSGADLAHLCELATESAMEASMESGDIEPITTARLVAARKEIGPSTRAWFDVAYNYAMFANEGGLYDELLDYVKEHKLR
jgi:SpoVK/Ycf46/Vps4 family AAA+-type ATPase